MNLTIENTYCQVPITAETTGILVRESYEFCTANNPLFLERPEWLRQATCIHKNVFWIFYVLILVATIGDKWNDLKFPLSLFLGAKVYAILFYHYMEFNHENPPPNVVMYFVAEGAYLISMGIVAYKLIQTVTNESKEKDRLQENDSKLIMQLSKKLDNVLMENDILRDQNDRLSTRPKQQ